MRKGEESAGQAVSAGIWDEFDLVPLYDVEVSAGPGCFVDGHEAIIAQMAFRKYWLRQEGLQAQHLAVVRARGDSMEPTINEGDVLLLDRTRREPEGGYIYIVQTNSELRAKRLQRMIDGSVRVSSDNRAYADEVVDREDLHYLHIVGRVVWKGGMM